MLDYIFQMRQLDFYSFSYRRDDLLGRFDEGGSGTKNASCFFAFPSSSTFLCSCSSSPLSLFPSSDSSASSSSGYSSSSDEESIFLRGVFLLADFSADLPLKHNVIRGILK